MRQRPNPPQPDRPSSFPPDGGNAGCGHQLNTMVDDYRPSQSALLRIALAMTVPLLAASLSACSAGFGDVSCSVDALSFNNSGPGQGGVDQICVHNGP